MGLTVSTRLLGSSSTVDYWVRMVMDLGSQLHSKNLVPSSWFLDSGVIYFKGQGLKGLGSTGFLGSWYYGFLVIQDY